MSTAVAAAPSPEYLLIFAATSTDVERKGLTFNETSLFLLAWTKHVILHFD